MSNTPILSLPQVATNQNQKETTINSALAILEAACNDDDSFSLASGNRTLNATEFTRAFHLIFSGQTAARDVTFPSTPRFLAISNTGAYNIVLKTAGVGTTVTVEPAKKVLVISDGTNVVAITAGISLLSSLSDVVGALDASAGQVLAYDADSMTWGPIDNFADHSFFKEGSATSDEILYRHVCVRDMRLLSDFSGSQGVTRFMATSDVILPVYKNETFVGTITFEADTLTPMFSTDVGSGSTSVTFAPGDYLTIAASTYIDPTLADFAVTLKGVYL